MVNRYHTHLNIIWMVIMDVMHIQTLEIHG